MSAYFWTAAEIAQRLERIVSEAFAIVWNVAQNKSQSQRTAVFVVACQRVREGRALRGLYP